MKCKLFWKKNGGSCRAGVAVAGCTEERREEHLSAGRAGAAFVFGWEKLTREFSGEEHLPPLECRMKRKR